MSKIFLKLYFRCGGAHTQSSRLSEVVVAGGGMCRVSTVWSSCGEWGSPLFTPFRPFTTRPVKTVYGNKGEVGPPLHSCATYDSPTEPRSRCSPTSLPQWRAQTHVGMSAPTHVVGVRCDGVRVLGVCIPLRLRGP